MCIYMYIIIIYSLRFCTKLRTPELTIEIPLTLKNVNATYADVDAAMQ